ncbi:phosphatidylinositol-4-phosphate 5-kinase family protein, partial [Reticulomyxa filosa]
DNDNDKDNNNINNNNNNNDNDNDNDENNDKNKDRDIEEEKVSPATTTTISNFFWSLPDRIPYEALPSPLSSQSCSQVQVQQHNGCNGSLVGTANNQTTPPPPSPPPPPLPHPLSPHLSHSTPNRQDIVLTLDFQIQQILNDLTDFDRSQTHLTHFKVQFNNPNCIISPPPTLSL